MEPLITYGLSDGQLKHISEVENGLACNCICPSCNAKLVAKNKRTNKRTAHFAHHNGHTCEGAYETLIHLLAKDLLAKHKKLFLPDFHWDYNHQNQESIIREGELITFENVFLEKQVGISGAIVIPDAICSIGNKQLFVEFAKTHFVDENKRQALTRGEFACIEIDLREVPLDPHNIFDILISNTGKAYWISNPLMDKRWEEETARRLKQKEWEKQKIEKEYLEKFRKYRNTDHQLIRIDKDWIVVRCPKKKRALNEFKKTNFYKHPVLKKIIDGAYWNGDMYGYFPNGKWIFVNREKVHIFPPDSEWDISNTSQERVYKYFYKGLLEIARVAIKNVEIGDCDRCAFSVDQFFHDGNWYQVCGFE